MKKSYIIIPVTLLLLVVIFLVFKFFTKQKEGPCESIFQQTAVQLKSSLKVLQQTGGISIGEQKIQDLSEAAQVVALNLKTCCIMNINHQITSEEFLKCQAMGDHYNQQVNDLAKNVDIVEQAKKTNDSVTINKTVTVINSQLTNLQQSVQQITGDAGKPSPETVSTSGRINVLNAKFGGHIIMAPTAEWARSIDSIEASFSINCIDCDGVYGFKDGRKATFDMFTTLVPDKSLNIKEFALYAGNDSPTGQFDSIGRFTTQNVRLFDTPYQEFKFPAVTAKYFKIKVFSFWDNSQGWAYEFQLWGQLK